ncbi:hypothetical protein ACOMHN_039093 [Nucella lapillus]
MEDTHKKEDGGHTQNGKEGRRKQTKEEKERSYFFKVGKTIGWQRVPDYDSGFDSSSASPSTRPSSHGGQAKASSTPTLPGLKRLTIPLVRVDSPEFFSVGSPLFLGVPVKRERSSSQEERAAQEKLLPPPPLLLPRAKDGDADLDTDMAGYPTREKKKKNESSESGIGAGISGCPKRKHIPMHYVHVVVMAEKKDLDKKIVSTCTEKELLKLIVENCGKEGNKSRPLVMARETIDPALLQTAFRRVARSGQVRAHSSDQQWWSAQGTSLGHQPLPAPSGRLGESARPSILRRPGIRPRRNTLLGDPSLKSSILAAAHTGTTATSSSSSGESVAEQPQ